MLIYSQLLQEERRLCTQLEQIHNTLEQLPEGKLIYSKNGSRYKFFRSNGSHPVYIPKADYPLAEQLALRKYYSLKYDELSQQLKTLRQFIYDSQHYSNESDSFLEPDSPYYSLIHSHFQPDSDLDSWMNQPYVHNTNHPEHLIHKCISGQLVRSKSEVIIANALFLNQIPFRYECELVLNETTLFPDFTI